MVAHEMAGRISPGMWRESLAKRSVTKCARIFAVRILAPMMARSGRIRPAAVAEIAERYARERDRKTITPRRIRQLVAELIGAGVLGRDGRPAPGRTARYRALMPGAGMPRPMIVRPRGIAPKRLHAAFTRETSGTDPPAYPAPRD